MTTTTRNEPAEADLDAASLIHPTEILMSLIVIILAPMFLTASNGDILFARMAALSTVNAYRGRDEVDLIAIAQIIACGLTALGSLSLSMIDDLSLSMTLRLRNNANSLIRSSELTRRALKELRPDTAESLDAEQEPDENFAEAVVAANVAAVQRRAAETLSRIQPPILPEAPILPMSPIEAQLPAPPSVQLPIPMQSPVQAPIRAQSPTQAPIPPQPPIKVKAQSAIVIPVPTTTLTPTLQIPQTDRDRQAAWGAAAAGVAAEYIASLPNLPPIERKKATMRAAVLSSCAQEWLSGNGPPRCRPGDLAALFQPKV